MLLSLDLFLVPLSANSQWDAFVLELHEPGLHPPSANNLDVFWMMIMFVLYILISPLLNETLVWCFEEKGTRRWACYRSWFGIRCLQGEGTRGSHDLAEPPHAARELFWFNRNKLLTESSLCWWDEECRSIYMRPAQCNGPRSRVINLQVACYHSQWDADILSSAQLRDNYSVLRTVIKGNIQSWCFLWIKRPEVKIPPAILFQVSS